YAVNRRYILKNSSHSCRTCQYVITHIGTKVAEAYIVQFVIRVVGIFKNLNTVNQRFAVQYLVFGIGVYISRRSNHLVGIVSCLLKDFYLFFCKVLLQGLVFNIVFRIHKTAYAPFFLLVGNTTIAK